MRASSKIRDFLAAGLRPIKINYPKQVCEQPVWVWIYFCMALLYHILGVCIGRGPYFSFNCMLYYIKIVWYVKKIQILRKKLVKLYTFHEKCVILIMTFSERIESTRWIVWKKVEASRKMAHLNKLLKNSYLKQDWFWLDMLRSKLGFFNKSLGN